MRIVYYGLYWKLAQETFWQIYGPYSSSSSGSLSKSQPLIQCVSLRVSRRNVEGKLFFSVPHKVDRSETIINVFTLSFKGFFNTAKSFHITTYTGEGNPCLKFKTEFHPPHKIYAIAFAHRKKGYSLIICFFSLPSYVPYNIVRIAVVYVFFTGNESRLLDIIINVLPVRNGSQRGKLFSDSIQKMDHG